MTAEYDGMDYGGFAVEPKSAVFNGDWLLVAVTKFWYAHKSQAGNTSEDGGLTFEFPYGNEILLALPIVENPTSALPEGCITKEQLQIALKAAIQTVKLSKGAS